jgi:hypothetical protein
MSNKNRKTNVEVVTNIMEYSNNGALMQAFIIEAIHNYCSNVIKAGPEVFNNGMLNGNSWVACAEEATSKINKHYDRS